MLLHGFAGMMSVSEFVGTCDGLVADESAIQSVIYKVLCTTDKNIFPCIGTSWICWLQH